jgi:tRNA nucleotidyltransferase (CCA-adding enzyme)
MDTRTQFESSLPVDRQLLLRFVADVAAGHGFPIYMVGGSVRDLILGRAIGDFDLTIEGDAGALAESILRRLGGKITVHSKFRTARWTLTESTVERLGVPMFEADNLPLNLDFVSARSETYAHPGALPTIKRSGIEDDLHRRDFTINAMAVRLDGIHFGELVDPLNGQKDIENKLIRMLHKRSFIDDPTRMFRAIRYSMRYQFNLETDTRNALYDNEARNVLSQLSGERIRHEFDLIFEEERPVLSLAALDDASGLTRVIHPALENGRPMLLSYMKYPSDDFGKFDIPEILSFRQTLGWVLYLLHLPETDIDSVAERLAFPTLLTRSVRAVAKLTKDISLFKDWRPSQWTFYLDEIPSIAIYAVWLISPGNESLSKYLTKWRYVKPFTTGDELKQLGLEPGPRYKEILFRLRIAWLDGDVKTREKELELRDRLVAK